MKKLKLIYRILTSQSFYIRLERNNKVITASKDLRLFSAEEIVNELLQAIAAQQLEQVTQKQNQLLNQANDIINGVHPN